MIKLILNESNIFDWSNVTNSLGLSYLSTINYFYSAKSKKMSFWDSPTSNDRITLNTYDFDNIYQIESNVKKNKQI